MTRLLGVEPVHINEAAAVLRRGGLVAFPTETVYGLGASALDPSAVQRIFTAKDRPATNPVIVHMASVEQLPLVAHLPPVIDRMLNRLAERFWPGPLTLVVPKTAAVPDAVTAGGPTVAVRVPAHLVALALLTAVGVPLAAPSANRSTEVSPTTAEHVIRSIGGRIDMVLDGGPTSGGIESTVLDLTTDPPRLLRPGLVSVRQLQAVIGPVTLASRRAADTEDAPLPSPGMMAKHYAPRAALELADDDGRMRVEELVRQGHRVGWLTWPTAANVPTAVRIKMPSEATSYAARLYAALHDLDAANVGRIVVARPPDDEEWLAIFDRLRRASG
jgi:L-threonylcarbamoyladenylate synthase